MILRRRPEFDAIVPADADVTMLAGGFDMEGPVWVHERDELVFSDHKKSNRYTWSEAAGLSMIAEDTNHANGMTRDLDGNLVVCERGALVRFDAAGVRSVLTQQVDGASFHFAADPIVESNGNIYFTGSTAQTLEEKGLRPRGDGTVEFVEPKRDAHGNLATGAFVALLRPAEQSATQVAGEFGVANGIAFSPDESLLYAVDTRFERIRAFPVNPDGTLDLERQSVLFQFDRGNLVGLCDGMAVDVNGNIYCAAPGGVWVITPEGEHLGTISAGENERHTNCCFGGRDWTTLYITTHAVLASIELSATGLPTPHTTVLSSAQI